MKKLTVEMQWGGQQNHQWMMNHADTGFFLMNFPDCQNVNRYFEGLNRTERTVYEITIKRRNAPHAQKKARPFLASAVCAAMWVFCLMTPLADANETVLLTEEKCVQSALAHNPALKIAELDGVQAGAGQSKAIGKMLPVLSTSAYGALSTDEPVLAFDVRATQPVFLGGELVAEKNKADAGVQISRHKKALSEAEIAYLARRLFFEIKKKEAEVKLAEESLIHAKKLKDVSQTLVTKEVKPQVVLLQRMTEVSQKEKEFLEQQQKLDVLYDRLLYVTALDPTASYVLADLDMTQASSERAVSGENKAIESILGLQIRQARQDLKIAKSERFPKVFLVSRYRYEEETFYEKNAFEAAVLVKWSLWDFGITSSEIRKNKAELSKQKWLKAEELEKHNAQLRQVKSALETKEKVITIARRDMNAAEEQFKNAKARHINGDISALNLDAARLRKLEAETRLIQAFCDYEMTKALFFKLLGLIGVEE